MPAVRELLTVVLVMLLGCASDEEVLEPPPDSVSCADPLALALPDGSCIRPGVPADGCAEGFVHDGEYGCNAILPTGACPAGLMALPGETACRPVMPCGEGRWGDIAVDASTVYVDAAYTGGASDGSEARPWTSIGEGVMAAASGALIAIARGSYVEDVLITGKAVRLAGVCPDEVSIEGAGQLLDPCLETPTICVLAGADGTAVQGVSISGPGRGLFVTGSGQVLVDRVWVHDVAARGISADNTLGAASLGVRGSLVDKSHRVGLYVGGSEANIEATVVRGTLPDPLDQSRGRGIVIQFPCPDMVCEPTARAYGTVKGSLVEETHHDGLMVWGSDAHVEGSVVRNILPDSEQLFGVGIEIRGWCVDTSMGMVCDPAVRSNVTVQGSLVEQTYHHGLGVSGSDALIEATVVRDTKPRPSDGRRGMGILIQPGCEMTAEGVGCDVRVRANITMLRSFVDRSHVYGVFVAGSDAHIESSVVRDTAPELADQRAGYGMSLQVGCISGPLGTVCNPESRTNATVLGSLVERSYDIGVFVGSSDARIEASIVRSTSPRASDGRLGDGIIAGGDTAPAALTVARTRIVDSARAGLSSFGSLASLESTRIHCAAFALAGERYKEQDFSLEDRGDNLCGCPNADGVCKASSIGLEPPAPLASTE